MRPCVSKSSYTSTYKKGVATPLGKATAQGRSKTPLRNSSLPKLQRLLRIGTFISDAGISRTKCKSGIAPGLAPAATRN